MTNKYRTTFYIGITNDLHKRIVKHQNGIGSEFTRKYNLKDLISVSYKHLRAHETKAKIVCRLLLEKKKKKKIIIGIPISQGKQYIDEL